MNPYEGTATGIINLQMLQELMQLFAQAIEQGDRDLAEEIKTLSAKYNHALLGDMLIKWFQERGA